MNDESTNKELECVYKLNHLKRCKRENDTCKTYDFLCNANRWEYILVHYATECILKKVYIKEKSVYFKRVYIQGVYYQVSLQASFINL